MLHIVILLCRSTGVDVRLSTGIDEIDTRTGREEEGRVQFPGAGGNFGVSVSAAHLRLFRGRHRFESGAFIEA